MGLKAHPPHVCPQTGGVLAKLLFQDSGSLEVANLVAQGSQPGIALCDLGVGERRQRPVKDVDPLSQGARLLENLHHALRVTLHRSSLEEGLHPLLILPVEDG